MGVLAGAALPRAVWVAEVHTHAGGRAQFGVPRRLPVLAVGQALAHRRSNRIELGGEYRQRGPEAGRAIARVLLLRGLMLTMTMRSSG